MFGSKDVPKLVEKNNDSSLNRLSTIAAGVKISGDIDGIGDICINGTFEGNVTCGKLIIGITGKIDGTINADILVVFGTLYGKATAKSVQLMDSAIVTGDIYHDILEILPGAKVDGHYGRKIKINTSKNIKPSNKNIMPTIGISDASNMISLKAVENKKQFKL